MILPSRRLVLLGIAASAAPGVPAAAYPKSLGFVALRDGRKIGEHRVFFEEAGDALTVRARAEMKVKLGPVTVYRYLHEVVEEWRGPRFAALSSRTNSNGKRESVEARWTPRGVSIRAAAASATVAIDALPMTHWNRHIVGAPLFNPQTGKLLRLTARDLGEETVALADGSVVQARCYAFRGDAHIDDWYDEGGWVALRGRLDDGSTMEYRRL